MPSILVSGPVRGNYTSLFKAVAKAQKKGEFAAALCVGNFLGETRDAPAESAPLPVYVVTGEDAIDANLASRLAAKNIRWLGRSGCEEVAGLRVGFLGGTYDEAAYDEAAPDDRSDAPHYTCDDVRHCVEINQCVGCSRNRHRHAIEQASRRWRGGRDDSADERAVKF